MAIDETGRARFEWLQNFPRLGGQLVYYVFDLLYLDGYDLRGLPLECRKEILAEMPDLPRVKLCEHIEEHGVAFYRLAGEMGLEGIVAKHRKSLYREGRPTRSWQKIKHRQRAEVLVCGFTRHPGALLVGVRRGNEVLFAGAVEYGFKRTLIDQFQQLLIPLVQESCPFRSKPKTEGTATWLKPSLVAEVAFHEWTAAGQLRHPSFVAFKAQ